MTNNETKTPDSQKTTEQQKPLVKNAHSPFKADPYNNRHGKRGGGGFADIGGAKKGKSMNVAKNYGGGSGGDR